MIKVNLYIYILNTGDIGLVATSDLGFRSLVRLILGHLYPV